MANNDLKNDDLHDDLRGCAGFILATFGGLVLVGVVVLAWWLS